VNLLIISPQYQETYRIEWLKADTPHGNIVIKSGHAPIILTLIGQSELSFLLTTGEEVTIQLTRPGLLEIDRKNAIALINQTTDTI
jgi:hypothetical protein